MSNSVEGKYVFLEHRVNWSTEKISGGCPAGQSYYCPKSYDMNNSVLIVDSDTYGNAPVNESMVLFCGVQNRVGGTDGFDCGNNGWFSYSLPGQFSENITIDSVSEEGTVAFHFMDFSGKLKPFERWENISRHRYHYDKTCVDGECLPECTKDIVKGHSLFNGGFLDKKSILLLQTTG